MSDYNPEDSVLAETDFDDQASTMASHGEDHFNETFELEYMNRSEIEGLSLLPKDNSPVDKTFDHEPKEVVSSSNSNVVGRKCSCIIS